MVETGREGRRLAEVPGELQDQDMVVLFGEVRQDPRPSVVASVIDEQDLVVDPEPLEHPGQTLVQVRQVGFLVVDGNNDGQSRLGLIHPGC